MILECVAPSGTRDVISINERAATDASASPRYPYAPFPDHLSVSLLVPGVSGRKVRKDRSPEGEKRRRGTHCIARR